jgi:hypothetical protein
MSFKKVFGKVLGNDSSEKGCAALESDLIAYLDGRARPAERRAVEKHLAACASCSLRAEEFRALSLVLDDLPEIAPSPEFDASLFARIDAEPARRNFWDWMPSPRLAFAVTTLVVMSVWLSSMPRHVASPSVATLTPPPAQAAPESDFGMIRDLPVLENYDVVSKFDALSELPGPASGVAPQVVKENR